MMDKRKLAFIIIPIIWMATIWGYVGYKEMQLKNGREVVLATVPVDPRDIFRGEYVTLKYEISDIETYVYSNYYGTKDEFTPTDFEEGDTVYVSLREIEKGSAPEVKYSAISKTKPSGYAQPFIKGIVKNATSVDDYSSYVNLEVEYGIESYFIEEGTGRDIEARARRGNLKVHVVLDKDGNATIKSLE